MMARCHNGTCCILNYLHPDVMVRSLTKHLTPPAENGPSLLYAASAGRNLLEKYSTLTRMEVYATKDWDLLLSLEFGLG
jgi:hypothetical protein